MRVSYTKYPNSKAATALSVFGTILWVTGVWCVVYALAGELPMLIVGAVFVLLGFFMVFKARKVNEKACFNKWLQETKEKNVDIQNIVTQSLEGAIQLYANMPFECTLDYIKKYNPEAANKIEEMIRLNNKNK